MITGPWPAAIVSVTVAVTLAVARPGPAAAADSSIPLHVDFAAPAGCSSAAAFLAGVRARLNPARRAQPGEKGVLVRVRLNRTGARVHGALSVIDARGETDRREVDSGSCDEVVEVLSLTVALALDPGVAAAPSGSPRAASPHTPPATATDVRVPRKQDHRAASGGTDVPPTAPAKAPASDSAPPVAAPPTTRTAAQGSPPPKPSPPPPPFAEAPAAPAPVAPPKAPEAPAPPPVPKNDPTPAPVAAVADDAPAAGNGARVSIGARGVATQVVAPYVSLGGSVAVTVTGRRDGRVPASAELAFLYVPNDFLLPPPDVQVRWTAAALTVCAPWGLGGVVQVQPCALAIGGWLAAAPGRDVEYPMSAGRSWWSLGGAIRASAALGAGFFLNLDVGVSVPLIRRRFIITQPLATLGETPWVSALAGLGISYPL